MLNADEDDFMRSLPDPKKKGMSKIELLRERAFLKRVEEIEGKVPSQEEVRKFGSVWRNPDKPEEFILWRGKRILYIWIDVETDEIIIREI